MEKEEKLDEILRAKTGESQSNILNLYKNARVLLNNHIEAGKGKVYLLSNGRSEYSLGLNTGGYRFLFIYNNFDFPHLKIQASKAFYAENQFGSGSRQYHEPQLVLDVKEDRVGHLDVATYVVGENGDYSLGKWEGDLIREAQESLHKCVYKHGSISSIFFT